MRCRREWALLGATLIANPASASPEQPSAPFAVQTPQQQFDAGSAAIEAGDWAKALTIYDALERGIAAKNPNSKHLPVIRLRKGRALSKLGRGEEAEALIAKSIAQIPVNDNALAEDRHEGLNILGAFAEKRFDYAAAMGLYDQAFATAPADLLFMKMDALTRLIPVEIFVDADTALRHADIGLSLVARSPKANKEWPGYFHDLRGRALLNLGRIKEAHAEFETAIALLGKLGSGRINLLDAAARSDASIAAMQDNNPDVARKLLAYSGAARQSQEQFRYGSEMEPPSCGLNGPKPQDIAVVEFSIGDDGGVSFARPIYFSGKPGFAVDFAKAVAGWSWTPEQLKEISPFFRLQTRIELRCTTVFARPESLSMLYPAIEKWMADKGIASPLTDNMADAKAAIILKAELLRRETQYGSNSLPLLPVLVALFRNENIPSEPSEAYAIRALAIAKSVEIPAQPLAYLELSRWKYAILQGKSGARKFAAEVDSAFRAPVLASDPEATSAARIARFDFLDKKRREAEGRGLLQSIADDKRLQPNDPFRVGALTRLANLDYRAGRMAEARSHFEQSGLSSQQCALVDARPLQVAGRLSAGDYPMSAREWGFSGWTVIEFDIGADGQASGHRPIVSFPPFIFGPPVIKGMQRFRYEQTYRPGGGTGCGAMRYAQYFRFVIP